MNEDLVRRFQERRGDAPGVKVACGKLKPAINRSKNKRGSLAEKILSTVIFAEIKSGKEKCRIEGLRRDSSQRKALSFRE